MKENTTERKRKVIKFFPCWLASRSFFYCSTPLLPFPLQTSASASSSHCHCCWRSPRSPHCCCCCCCCWVPCLCLRMLMVRLGCRQPWCVTFFAALAAPPAHLRAAGLGCSACTSIAARSFKPRFFFGLPGGFFIAASCTCRSARSTCCCCRCCWGGRRPGGLSSLVTCKTT